VDQYEHIRSLPFPALASALGINLQRFKTRSGGEYYGPCPIHQPKNNTTSFSYAAAGKFHCFSCNAHGRGAIDLCKLVKNFGFKEAVETLDHIEPPKQKEPPKSDSVSNGGQSDAEPKPLEKDTWRKFAVPCPWLETRIPDATVRERYGVFCYNNPARRSAYSGRVMLPVKDGEGSLYGYLGRNIADNNPKENADSPKYLFPRNLPKHLFLFGAHEILAGTFGPPPVRVAYLVESPFCVMKFASLQIPAVSPYGWSVSPEQITLLIEVCRGVVYLPDKNKHAEAADMLGKLAEALWTRFPDYPGEDPEYLTLDQIHALTK